MTRNFDTNEYGNVSVRNIMIDTDGINLTEGIEIRIGFTGDLIEIIGYIDLDETSNEAIEELINQNS